MLISAFDTQRNAPPLPHNLDAYTPNLDDPIAPTYATNLDEELAKKVLSVDYTRSSYPMRVVFTLLDILRALTFQGGMTLREVDPELWRHGTKQLLGYYPDCVLVDQSFPFFGSRGYDLRHVLYVEAFDPHDWKLRGRTVATFDPGTGYHRYTVRYASDGSLREEQGDIHEGLPAQLQDQISDRVRLERLTLPETGFVDGPPPAARPLAELARSHEAVYDALR